MWTLGLEKMKREISRMKTGENIFVILIINILFEPKKPHREIEKKPQCWKKDCSRILHPYKNYAGATVAA